MNTLRLYSFFDQKAEAYMQPWSAPTRGHALRSFEDAVHDSDSLFGRHAEDFYLFEVGVFDLATGQIEVCHESLGNGVRFKVSDDGFQGVRSTQAVKRG